MGKQLFGTDGIRGVAGEYPLDARTVHALGQALGAWAVQHGPEPQVVIGMDTRASGPWLAEQVAGGLARHGVRVSFAGVITTPGVAYLTRTGPYVAGVMISASHNPYRDNGIKVFDHSGYKLPDIDEHRLEGDLFRLLEAGTEPQLLPLTVDEGLDQQYLEYLASIATDPLDGMRIVTDCGHGAASHLAPALFERLGARVLSIGCWPDGRNINLDCGALHVESLRQQVIVHRADAGVAFDGDADRAILIARSGKVVDGDHVLLMSASDLQSEGKLAAVNGRPAVVATVMSNLGLERALEDRGIQLLRTPVGDKYVLEEMIRSGAVLGGEQSGHVIFRENATTGDGILTALRVLEIMKRTGKSLDDLAAPLVTYPQRLVNVRVQRKAALDALPAVQSAIQATERAFGRMGRVLVRFSGTEPLARVMVEGPDERSVEDHAHRIAEAIQAELGA